MLFRSRFLMLLAGALLVAIGIWMMVR